MDHSLFMDQEVIPGDSDLKKVLGESYFLWDEIRKRVLEEYPAGKEEWNFPGKKYGWSFVIMASRVSDFIKQELSSKSSLPIKIYHYFYRLN